MHTGRAPHLRHAADALLDLLGGDEHKVCQLVDDYDDAGHGGLAVRRAVLIVIFKVAHAGLREEAVALEHFHNGPLQRTGSLLGVCDDGHIKMRDAVINAQLDHLGVDHYKPHLIRPRLVKEAEDERVHADGFAGAGRTGDEHMRKLRNIAHDAVAADILAERKAELGLGIDELGRFNDIAQVHGADDLIGDLNADGGYLVGNGRDAHVHNAKRKRKVTGEIRHAGKLDALLKLDIKARDRGAARHADDGGVYAEAVYRALKALLIDKYLLACVHIGRRARAQQADRRELIVRAVTGGGDSRLHGLGLGVKLGAAELLFGRVADLRAHGDGVHYLLHSTAKLVHVHTGSARRGLAALWRVLTDDGGGALLRAARAGIRGRGGIGLRRAAARVGKGQLLIVVIWERDVNRGLHGLVALGAASLRGGVFRALTADAIYIVECDGLALDALYLRMRLCRLRRAHSVGSGGQGHRLHLLLFLIRRAGGAGVHGGVILDGGPLTRLAEHLYKAAVEALDSEEYQQRKQHGQSAVLAESVLQADGDEAAEDTAALHTLALLKKAAGKHLYLRRIHDRLIEKETAERGNNYGDHECARHAQGDGLPPVEAENDRGHQKCRNREPEAPAYQPLNKAREKDDELPFRIIVAYHHEHRKEQKHDRAQLTPDGGRGRLRRGDGLRGLALGLCACFLCGRALL